MKSSAFTINEYISKIKNKKIIIPNFQREYVWSNDDIKFLISSYFYKLQIGAVLFYRNEKHSGDLDEKILPYLTFDSTEIKNSIEGLPDGIKHTYYVIDGQQRLTSTMISFTDYFDDKSTLARKYKRKYFLSIPYKTEMFGLRNLEFKPLSIGGDYDYEDFALNNIDYISANEKNYPQKPNAYIIPLEDLYNDEEKIRNNNIRKHGVKLATDSYFN
ncbi:MAG: DUF262 domain-containing protein, partial [Acholeplasmataceae bacterium]|nr:DUF262 domain-containing protein [Acholeplasmataceae bacterium]